VVHSIRRQMRGWAGKTVKSNPSTTRSIPERLCSEVSSLEGAMSSVRPLPLLFTFIENPMQRESRSRQTAPIHGINSASLRPQLPVITLFTCRLHCQPSLAMAHCRVASPTERSLNFYQPKQQPSPID